MLTAQPYDSLLVARVFDFCGHATPWHRRLWSSGSLLTLREVLEASEMVARGGVLSNGAMFNLCSFATLLVSNDPGIGDEAVRRSVAGFLKADPKNGGVHFQGLEYHCISQQLKDIEANYLIRWALALQDKVKRPKPERAARFLSAHMLDLGMHPDFLHQWWKYKVTHESDNHDLSEIISDANLLCVRPKTLFTILVLFEKGTTELSSDPRWLPANRAAEWLRKNGSDKEGGVQGGLELKIEARDYLSALEHVEELINRLQSRTELGTKNKFVLPTQVWFEGYAKPNQFLRRSRAVEVYALDRQDKVFPSTEVNPIDSALDLVSPLVKGPPSAAIAGGWAAVEALLTAPGDDQRVAAAERLASLVACSFPRAELTRLAFRAEKIGAPHRAILRACKTNRERAEYMMHEIEKGTNFPFPQPSDSASLERIKKLITVPGNSLKDVEQHALWAFKRFYRVRNLVLHGGQTDAVGLRASLRGCAPILGAALDRIVHAASVEGLSALELAARARRGLLMVGAPGGPNVLNMLDPW